MGIDLLLPTTRFDRPREVRRRHHHQGTKKDTLSGVHTHFLGGFRFISTIYIYIDKRPTRFGLERVGNTPPHPTPAPAKSFFFSSIEWLFYCWWGCIYSDNPYCGNSCRELLTRGHSLGKLTVGHLLACPAVASCHDLL